MTPRSPNSILLAWLTASTASLLASASNNHLRNQRQKHYEQQRIVGGSRSTAGDYPYFVEMGGCGGALVAPDVVLTAAHCGNLTGRQLSIGAYRKGSLAEGAQPRFCASWIRDPLYGSHGSPLNYDFALCKLDYPVSINTTFVTLELNEERAIPSIGTDLIVMGLGTLSMGGYSPQIVHNATVPYIDTPACNAMFSQDDDVVTDAMLCAGFEEGKKDTCQGDSGGPIVKRTYNGDGTFSDAHVGVVSWGEGCAMPNRPGVYARTSERASWIKSTICGTLNSVASFCEERSEQTPNVCTTGEELTIELTTDMYAFETCWALWELSGSLLASFIYLINNYTNVHTMCLEPATCYVWEVVDAYMDGFNGTYSFLLNGETIGSGTGTDFDKSKTETICTTGGSLAPAASPTISHTPFPVGIVSPIPPPTVAPTSDDSPTILPTVIVPPDQWLTNAPDSFRLVPTNVPTIIDDSDDYLSPTIQPSVPPEQWLTNAPDSFRPVPTNVPTLIDDFDDYLSPTIQPSVPPEQWLTNAPDSFRPVPTNVPTLIDDLSPTIFPVVTVQPDQGPTIAPNSIVLGPTNAPTFVVDLDDYLSPTTFAPTDTILETTFPSESPTRLRTNAPTNPPSDPPTNTPTDLPSTVPTIMAMAPPEDCVDDPTFRYRNSKKKTCSRWVKKKGTRTKKIRKKCKKKWKKRRVYEYCAETCGRLVGLGRCAALSNENDGSQAEISREVPSRTKKKDNSGIIL